MRIIFQLLRFEPEQDFIFQERTSYADAVKRDK